MRDEKLRQFLADYYKPGPSLPYAYSFVPKRPASKLVGADCRKIS